jgi:acid phosphatase family membrane protein YuiD
MGNFFDIVNNVPVRCAFWAWLIAQLLKIPFHLWFEHELDWRRMFGSGGMPSSHSSSTVAVSVSVGMLEGFDSPLFAAMAVLSMVVMYDAAGVRRAAGQHAAIINDIVEIIKAKEVLTEEKLKELIGHTPFEVAMGALLGIAVGIIVTLASVA